MSSGMIVSCFLLHCPYCPYATERIWYHRTRFHLSVQKIARTNHQTYDKISRCTQEVSRRIYDTHSTYRRDDTTARFRVPPTGTKLSKRFVIGTEYDPLSSVPYRPATEDYRQKQYIQNKKQYVQNKMINCFPKNGNVRAITCAIISSPMNTKDL
jgi:hypothetical protein